MKEFLAGFFECIFWFFAVISLIAVAGTGVAYPINKIRENYWDREYSEIFFFTVYTAFIVILTLVICWAFN